MHDIQQKWEEIKLTIKKEYDLSDISFKTWIFPLKFHEVEKNIVKIVIPSDQAQSVSYISSKYKLYFQVIISEMFNEEYEISFLLEKDLDKDSEKEKENVIYNINSAKANLNPKYNFDTFVVGNNNNLAHAAALAAAESPGEVYNPLFLYGGSGLGKTHLMHSIGHFILEQNSEMKVLYVNSEEFTNEVIESIRSGNAASMNRLRDKYRNIDVLLFDDLQFIIGKERTQEEFFHTFNTLHTRGKQIILCSDKPPKEMEILDERFRSRFAGGLIADIQAPDYETRMAILKKNTSDQGIEIDDDILKYIADNIKSNIRDLEGALRKVIVSSRLNNRELSMDIAEDALKDIIYPEAPKEVTPDLIMNIVADHFELSVADIKSSKRNSELVLPRQIFMYLCRDMIDIPYKSIASFLGKKDHSTIIHGENTIKAKMETNDDIKNKVEIIKKKIIPV